MWFLLELCGLYESTVPLFVKHRTDFIIIKYIYTAQDREEAANVLIYDKSQFCTKSDLCRVIPVTVPCRLLLAMTVCLHFLADR